MIPGSTRQRSASANDAGRVPVCYTKRAHVLTVIAIISVALFSLTVLAIGVHLIALAYKTRKAPEFLLGFSFVLSQVGNFVIVTSIESGLIESPGGADVARVGTVLLALGFAAAAAFNAVVFRPGVKWAVALAWLLGGGIVVVEVATWVLIAGMEGYDALFGVKFGLRIAIYAWSAVEAFRYYGLMSRRLRHGLADAVVANRLGATLILTLAHLREGNARTFATVCTSAQYLAAMSAQARSKRSLCAQPRRLRMA